MSGTSARSTYTVPSIGSTPLGIPNRAHFCLRFTILDIPDRPVSVYFVGSFGKSRDFAPECPTGCYPSKKTGLFGAVWMEDLEGLRPSGGSPIPAKNHPAKLRLYSRSADRTGGAMEFRMWRAGPEWGPRSRFSRRRIGLGGLPDAWRPRGLRRSENGEEVSWSRGVTATYAGTGRRPGDWGGR